MYLEASINGAASRRTRDDVLRTIREGLYPFEQRLQRVQVWAESGEASHLCCLQAWSERGQTLAIERRAASLDEAVREATTALARALGQGRTSETITRPYASRVLLVLHELDREAPSLRWARRLTEALAGGLDACRVLLDTPNPAALGPGRPWLQATRRLLATQRDTRAWCSDALPEAVLAERVIPGAGDAVAELAALARRKGSDWIVMPADGISGATALALADAAGCPVLVGRPFTSRSTVLVSADLQVDNRAALTSAAELSEALNAPVLAFHNVSGFPPGERFAPGMQAIAECWRAIQSARHPLEAGRRVPELDVLLGCARERAEALLSQARREDAELIVVGVTAGADADAGRALAREVVERAQRAVLVVPAEASAALEPGTRRSPPRSGVVPAGPASAPDQPSTSSESSQLLGAS